MKEFKRPYSAKALKKWSAFRIDPVVWGDKSYESVRVPLTRLVKHKDYAWLKDKLNKLYTRYNYPEYDILWKELEEFNSKRRERFIQEDKLRRSEYSAKFQLEELVLHFGEIPKYVLGLTEEEHAIRLEWARLKYDIEPDYGVCELYLKDVYTVPERVVKDYRLTAVGEYEYKEYPSPDEDDDPLTAADTHCNIVESEIYYTDRELGVDSRTPRSYNTIVGKATVVSAYARKLAEQAAIRDALWCYKHCPEFAKEGSMDDLRFYSEWEIANGIPEQNRAWQLAQERNVKTYKR